MLPNSYEYWDNRYRTGGSSGSGSSGTLAHFKANTINAFVRERAIKSVIEFGCGDGNQLSLAHYPSYTGLDVSQTAIMKCAQRFVSDMTKSFLLYDSRCFFDRAAVLRCDLALSLDVIYHLIEDDIFYSYLVHLFSAARRFVIVYSTNHDFVALPHIRHRRFLPVVGLEFKEWRLMDHMSNQFPDESPAEFFFFCRDE